MTIGNIREISSLRDWTVVALGVWEYRVSYGRYLVKLHPGGPNPYIVSLEEPSLIHQFSSGPTLENVIEKVTLYHRGFLRGVNRGMDLTTKG